MIKSYRLFTEGKKKDFPYIKEYNMDGFVIYLGKDELSNDHLTFNVADDDDIWFHTTNGVPGSHVVLKINNNRLPSEEVIKYAAEIAKKNSKGSKLDNVTVVYCKRKFVTKEPHMKAGQVKADHLNSNKIVI